MELQPDQVVKLDSGRRLHQKVIKKRVQVRIPGVCCSETKILMRFSLLISRVDTWFREFVFRIAQGVRTSSKQKEGW